MKKLIFLILIGVVIGSVYIAKSNTSPELGFQRPDDSKTFKPDPSSATFVFDDGSIALSDGRGEIKFPDSEFKEEIKLLDTISYGDLNNDKKEDALVFLSRSGGGSGTFIYTAAFVSGPVSYKGSNVIFLGDRISPQSIYISNGISTVKYLDRNKEDSFSTEPTLLVSKQFVFKNSSLEEK